MTSTSLTRLRERRQDRRVRLLWGAGLRFPDANNDLTCTVSNISAGGAKLTHEAWPEGAEAAVVDALQPGVEIRLAIPNVGEFPGEVVWCARGRLGMRFRLDPEEVIARLAPVLDLR